jgi:hypothetical protein
MTLLSDTAYHSFIGEVEALNTTTIRRLTRSRRHQLLAIAPPDLPLLVRQENIGRQCRPGCERQLTRPPSKYFKRQCYLALDADEEPAVDVVEKLGADYFVVSTD